VCALSIVGVAAATLLAGCTHNTTRPGPVVTTSNAAPADDLVGFGATLANWNRHHEAARSVHCDEESAYDADARLDSFPGCPGSKYVAIADFGGRVEMYEMNFLAGTTLSATLAAELTEVPRDAQLVRVLRPGPCVISFFQSKLLGQLDPTNLPGGRFSVASEVKPTGRRFLSFVPDDPTLPPITRC